MKKTIFLCASMAFYKELVEIEKKLIARGFNVQIPVSAQTMKDSNDFVVEHFKGRFSYAQKGVFIHKNLERIANSDAILVINGEKHGIPGYIGTNVLMEIGIAFYFKKNIYIWNPIKDDAPYAEELLSFAVQFIERDLDKIQL